MTKPATPTTAPQLIDAAGLHAGNLLDAISLHNGIETTGMQAQLFSPDMTEAFVFAHLSKHLAATKDLGVLREELSAAVEVRADAVKRGGDAHVQLMRLVNGWFPQGKPGRVDFFPKSETDPTLGDLLAAIGHGAAKHKRELPPPYTAASLVALGAEVNAALDKRAKSGALRSGQSKAAATLEKTTAEIRRRLRDNVTGWYGLFDAKLLDFGIQPQKPRIGRPRKGTPGPTPGVPQPAGI